LIKKDVGLSTYWASSSDL